MSNMYFAVKLKHSDGFERYVIEADNNQQAYERVLMEKPERRHHEFVDSRPCKQIFTKKLVTEGGEFMEGIEVLLRTLNTLEPSLNLNKHKLDNCFIADSMPAAYRIEGALSDEQVLTLNNDPDFVKHWVVSTEAEN